MDTRGARPGDIKEISQYRPAMLEEIDRRVERRKPKLNGHRKGRPLVNRAEAGKAGLVAIGTSLIVALIAFGGQLRALGSLLLAFVIVAALIALSMAIWNGAFANPHKPTYPTINFDDIKIVEVEPASEPQAS